MLFETDRNQNCLGLNCVENIFVNRLRQKLDEISYDNKSLIAFSVTRLLCSSGVRSLGLFIGTQNATKVTRIMIIELAPTKKDRTILNLKSMATDPLQDRYIKRAKYFCNPFPEFYT